MQAEVTSPHATGSTRRVGATARLCEALRSRIESGEWKPGERVPSEPALASELNASRGSLRGALAVLENEGLVVRRHGSGTFVRERPVLLTSLHLNTSADEMISSTGRTASTQNLSWRKIVASPEIVERLRLAGDAEVWELYRVRAADGVPVTVSFDYLPLDVLPDQPALLGPSLYSFLASVCGVEISTGVADLSPVVASDEIAEALKVDVGALCLLIRQVDYDAEERPRSYSVEYHLASAFRFELLRRGPAGIAYRQVTSPET